MDLNVDTANVTLAILLWTLVQCLKIRLQGRTLRVTESLAARKARGGGVL